MRSVSPSVRCTACSLMPYLSTAGARQQRLEQLDRESERARETIDSNSAERRSEEAPKRRRGHASPYRGAVKIAMQGYEGPATLANLGVLGWSLPQLGLAWAPSQWRPRVPRVAAHVSRDLTD